MSRNDNPLHTHTAETADHPWTPDTLAAHLTYMHGLPAAEAVGVAALEKLHGHEHARAARDTTASPQQREKAIDRLYGLAKGSVNGSWENPRQLLGLVLYRALLGEELLRLCAAQDETISADAVRAMAAGFWQRLCDDREVNGDGAS